MISVKAVIHQAWCKGRRDMAYYLLTVRLPGSWSYKEVASAKHQFDAQSLSDAKWQADAIIDDHYEKIDKATMRLFDSTGLLATREGEGEWDA
jgi:hypothetical protein